MCFCTPDTTLLFARVIYKHTKYRTWLCGGEDRGVNQSNECPNLGWRGLPPSETHQFWPIVKLLWLIFLYFVSFVLLPSIFFSFLEFFPEYFWRPTRGCNRTPCERSCFHTFPSLSLLYFLFQFSPLFFSSSFIRPRKKKTLFYGPDRPLSPICSFFFTPKNCKISHFLDTNLNEKFRAKRARGKKSPQKEKKIGPTDRPLFGIRSPVKQVFFPSPYAPLFIRIIT